MKAKKSFKNKLLRYFLFAVVYFILSVLIDWLRGHEVDWFGALFISIILSLVVVSITNMIDRNKSEGSGSSLK